MSLPWLENSNQVVDVPSLYLRLLAELGVVGLLAFLLFIGSVLWAFLKIRDRARFDATLFVFCTGLFSAVLGDLVQRASFVGIATDAYLWVLWGLAISIVRIVRTETPLGKVPQLVVPAG